MISLHQWIIMGWAILGSFGTNAQTMRTADTGSTPAEISALKFMRGVNFGNYLEYAAGNPAADSSYTLRDFQLARGEGFDHIRLPVAWALYCGPGPNYTISSDIFKKTDLMVNNAIANGLNVVVDLHHFNELMSDPGGRSNQFLKIWQQVATHYSSFPDSVAFELLNEPNGVATTPAMNGLYAAAIKVIRETNPNRTIWIGPGEYNSSLELSKLALPQEDRNLIATVHCYDPYYFTHQGAEWAYPDTKTVGIRFPGPPESPLTPDASIQHSWVLDWFKSYNRLTGNSNPSSPGAFKNTLQRAQSWAASKGRPVHVGEFGCYYKADATSRVNFYRAIRETMDQMGLGWTMWDWKSGFHYIANGAPNPSGMRQALFPPLEVSTAASGALSLKAAAGKTLIIERANSLVAPVVWTPIATQTLTSPQLDFLDPNPEPVAGFYRVNWQR